MNHYKRILSLFVALILLFSSTIHVSAAEFQSPNAVVETAGKPVLTESSNAETQKESAIRISEVISLRETNAETYLLSDGTYEWWSMPKISTFSMRQIPCSPSTTQ